MNFTFDWFSQNQTLFEQLLGPLRSKPDAKILEVGCFEGRASVWFLTNILIGPAAQLTVIDTFEGSEEHAHLNLGDLRERFDHNTRGFAHKVRTCAGKSEVELRNLPDTFDAIYIDGSHRPLDVLMDGILAWRLLRPGGVMVFDDYAWGDHLPPDHRPRVGIDAFVKVHRPYLETLAVGYAYAVKKL